MKRRSNWLDDRAQERARAIQACPHVDNPVETADNAALDALYLVEAVRELDPREVWGRLAIWAEETPIRLLAVTVALAAMVPEDQSLSALLAWIEQVTSPGHKSPHGDRLRLARTAYERGVRTEWVVAGNREYERLRKRRHRGRRRIENDTQKGAA